MAEDDNAVTGIERLVIQELFGIAFCPLKPEQLAHAAGAENIVPHDTRIGERIEADVAAITRIRLLGGQHRVARSEQMDRPSPTSVAVSAVEAASKAHAFASAAPSASLTR